MTISKSEPVTSFLTGLPGAAHYCVAYSGGLDSHVLLHAMAARAGINGTPLTAVHVDHGLQQASGDWAVHCRDVCRELDVPMTLLHVDARARPGESPEAAARHARYSALAEWLPTDAVLLTAQHREDQAETFLLQLFRGAGPRGLAAMPTQATFGNGCLVRPLLACSRADILAYAQRHRLRWVEDPSNTDTRYDRNLLRRTLLPAIRQRWPGLDRVLARAAALQADQAQLATALAGIDLAQAERRTGQLDADTLDTLDRARQRNLLRHWIEINRLPLPAHAVIEQIIDSVLAAGSDADPLVSWPGGEVRRYDGLLYAMPPQPPPGNTQRSTWNLPDPLALPAGGTLSATPVTGRGLRASGHDWLEVGFRRGGEILQPAGRAGHHALKKLFQEWRVPPWQRPDVPLLFRDGVLVAVAGYCVSEGHQAGEGEPGYDLLWKRADEPDT